MKNAYPFFNRPAARSLYEALITEDPFYITLERAMASDPAASREAMQRYMDFSMTEARDHGELVLTKDGESGAAVWAKPLEKEIAGHLAETKKTFILSHMGEKSLAAYTAITAFMAKKSQCLIPENAWYLSILGVHPDAQGQGLGRRLVAPVLETADAAGVPVYIESFTPKNFGFYERLGFHTADMISEPFTGADYALMIREASACR